MGMSNNRVSQLLDIREDLIRAGEDVSAIDAELFQMGFTPPAAKAYGGSIGYNMGGPVGYNMGGRMNYQEGGPTEMAMMQNPNPQMASRSANSEAGIAAALANERDPNKKINMAIQILQSMGEKGINIIKSSLSPDELQMLQQKIQGVSEQGVGSINTPQMAANGGRMGFADGGSSEIKRILRRNPALAEHYRYKLEMGFEGSFMDLMEQMAEEAYDDRPNYYDYNNGGRVGYQNGMMVASAPEKDEPYDLEKDFRENGIPAGYKNIEDFYEDNFTRADPDTNPDDRLLDDPEGTFNTDPDEVMKLIDVAMPGANPSDVQEAYDRAVLQGFEGSILEFIMIMGGDRRDLGDDMGANPQGIMSMMRA